MAKVAAKPVYALVGADSFLQLQELARIAVSLGDGAQRADFDGESAELADVFDELRCYSMFGGQCAKLVVVRDADEFLTRFRSALEDYAAAPSDSGVLVLRLSSLPKAQRIYKLIQKSGQIIECEPPGESGLGKWAMDHAKNAHRVTLAPDAAKLLVELIGADLGRLDTEIAKLAITADDAGGRITTDMVNANVAFTREREMKELSNAMAGGNVTEALHRWRELMQSDPSAEFRAVTWLGMWLEDVRLILTVGPNSPAVGRMKWKFKEPGSWNRFVAAAQTLGNEGYRRALDLLTEIDKQSKSGVGDAAENVERFILAMAPTHAR
jgi:DNA polymerase III delta subunit